MAQSTYENLAHVPSESVEGHPYAPLITKVERPGRYLGAEFGVADKTWSAVDGRMVMAFPDIYEVGMSHMGTRILYKIVNDQPDLLLDRCMMPWFDMVEQLQAHDLPLLGLEHVRPLSEYDVVGFSLQFELTYTNVLAMLDLGGIPLRSSERDDSMPLVVAGGPTATHPEPLAPFIDAFFIGEAEELLPGMIRDWVAMGHEGVPREARLRKLAKTYPLYVPSLYEVEVDERSGFEVISRPDDSDAEAPPFPVVRAMVEDLNEFPFPADGPEPLAEAVFDRAGIEVARGCTEGCRFCQAGMIYRPVRERSPESILKTLQTSLELGGHDEISLTSLSTADYSAIVPLIDELGEMLKGDRVSLSVSSLRAYGLPDRTLSAIRNVRATGLTFAPEAGSQRMRDVINKNVSEKDMLDTAERVFSHGWDRMKLYFMMGLPTEEDEDLQAITRVGGDVRKLGRRYAGRRAEVVVSVSVHVPKPHTPFQWCAMDPLEEIARKQSMLKFKAREARVKLRTHGAEPSFVEGILARGDRRIAEVLELAYKKGCRFDGWDEFFRFDLWCEAMDEVGVEPNDYLGTIPVDGRLPWDHLDVGLEDGFLAQEYKRAMKGRYSPPCGKPFGGAESFGKKLDRSARTSSGHHTSVDQLEADTRRLVCYDCGVACDLTKMRDERLDFLKSLGAQGPIEREEPELREQPQGGRSRRPPPRLSQGESVMVRLRYSRLSPAHLVGHLDTMRRIPRILRRAGVTPEYSSGFSPKPRMVFGPTLPLGTESLDEVIDLRIIEETLGELSTLPARLTAACPPGIEFRSAELIEAGRRSLSKAASEVEHQVFVVRTPDLLEGEDEDVIERLRQEIQVFLDSVGYEVTVERKDGTKLRDAREQVLGLEMDDLKRSVHAYSYAGEALCAIRVSQNLKPSPSVRPGELVAALLKDDFRNVDLEVVRSRVSVQEAKPQPNSSAAHG